MAMIFLALGVSLWPLCRRQGRAVPWSRLGLVFGTALLLWVGLCFLVPAILPPPDTGFVYPAPTWVATQLGQVGDAPLRVLVLYGAGVIGAAALIVAAAARMRPTAARSLFLILGLVAVSGGFIGLYVMHHCWGRAECNARTGSLFFLAKELADKREVPDEMLPLYDEDFRERILKSRAPDQE